MSPHRRSVPTPSGLGRGLDALFGNTGINEPAPGPELLLALPTNRIRPNPRQPRLEFREDELQTLSASIRQSGLLQPLVVRPDAERTGHYLLIAGERRWRAARQAGLHTVPAMVREASPQEALLLALIENIQRTDLSPLELAAAFSALAVHHGQTHAQIAELTGLSRTAVTNRIRLLGLPDTVKEALSARHITEGHARALLAVSDPAACQSLLQKIRAEELNVRQTEELIQTWKKADPAAEPVPAQPAGPATPVPDPPLTSELQFLERQLRERYQTRVSIQRRQTGAGRLILSFYDNESLSHLIGMLLATPDSDEGDPDADDSPGPF